MTEKNKNNVNIDFNKISLLMKIGLIGATINLAADMIIGWGIRNEHLEGIEKLVSHYLSVSDGRLFLSSILGLIGAPISVIAHYGIYKLIKPYSKKYSKLYKIGLLGGLLLGGPGVHMSSVAAAYFYKYMSIASPNLALNLSIKFVYYFCLPVYVPFFVFCLIETYAHIKAISQGFSPYPRWAWIFSFPIGTLIFSVFNLFGNKPLINAIMVGSLTLGNIWKITGSLFMLNRAKENWQKASL